MEANGIWMEPTRAFPYVEEPYEHDGKRWSLMETQWNPMEPNLMTSNGAKQNLMLVNLWGAYGAYGT